MVQGVVVVQCPRRTLATLPGSLSSVTRRSAEGKEEDAGAAKDDAKDAKEAAQEALDKAEAALEQRSGLGDVSAGVAGGVSEAAVRCEAEFYCIQLEEPPAVGLVRAWVRLG